MIISFSDEETQDIYDNIRSKKARKRLNIGLFRVAQRKLDMIDSASDIKDLESPPSNHLEVLKGNLKGMHSIRVNAQYRVVFKWTAKGAEKVKITDYH